MVDISIIYLSGEIVAFDKPAGMITQAEQCLDDPELWEVCQMLSGDLNIAHRIDRWTSGTVLAGTSAGRKYLQKHWHLITRKTYLAIIECPEWSSVVNITPLDGKTAKTSFKVLGKSGKYALVECELLQNGRRHQIRRHLKQLGHPIVGDKTYKGPKTEARPGQFLHAWKIEVQLPDEKMKPGTEWLKLQAPVPEDFKTFHFNWPVVDRGADEPVTVLTIPEDWKRKRKEK